MKERFEGPTGRATLVDALKRQEIVAGNAELANAFADRGQVLEFQKNDKLTVQDDEANDVFLLVAGSVAVVVNGTQVATRQARQHIGEMAAIEPAQKRSASGVAQETVVALKVSASDFMEIGEKYCQIWLPIARELARRLKQRNDLIPVPNDSPKLFIISSAESLPIAREIQSGLQHDVLPVVWTDGVFFAGGYSLEALEKAVEASDFAVAIAEPDDILVSRGEKSRTLRDNVLFELGLFMGKLTRYRTILVHPRVKDLKLPTDLHGLTLVPYNPGPDDLAARLGPVCTEIRKMVNTRGVRTLIA